MLDPSIFTDETPLTNLERLELWRRKHWGWKAETWWALTHHQDDGLVTDQIINDLAALPDFLRRQAQ